MVYKQPKKEKKTRNRNN